MDQSPKKYVITYSNHTSAKEVLSDVLHISTSSIEDGISVMASERSITEADVLHFDNLDVSVATLTDEQKVELEQRGDVLEVVEDFEMYALDMPETDGAAPILDSETILGLLPQSKDQMSGDQMYMLGFKAGQKAAQDSLAEKIRAFLELPNLQPGDVKDKFQPEQPVPAQAVAQPIPWHIQMVKAPAAWRRGITGFGIKVAVLDTGIANHTDLIVSGGASFISGVASFNDDNGHGTHCAGIIGARNNTVGVVGVAPRCSLFAVKVLNAAGSGPFSGIVAGLGWALANKMDVVSMSLGAVMPCQNAPAALVTAINRLRAAGCTVVAAAGNSFLDPNPQNRLVNVPGSIPGVIAVAAVDQSGQVATFSSRGGACNPVTLSAPGVSINSTFHSPANSYRVLSGTSMACPAVAGAVALIKQRFPAFTPSQIRTKLVSTTSDLGVPGNDPVYGSGLLNCDAATL
ncbi:S8 family peptidase [Tellurirhabdus rosea]|uniref:S8 family peptidase n=1 Tax=Tellurirhabdus rosea TaxID=2674997 RepID=UPI0022588BB4|nr:S8 family peptidase [Tellurirhabdus rosea]